VCGPPAPSAAASRAAIGIGRRLLPARLCAGLPVSLHVGGGGGGGTTT